MPTCIAPTDQVDAPGATPGRICPRIESKRRRHLRHRLHLRACRHRRWGKSRVGARERCRRPHVALDQLRLEAVATIVVHLQHDRLVGAIAEVRVKQRKTDGAQIVLVGRGRRDALSVEAGKGNRGAGGDASHLLSVMQDTVARA